MTKLLTVSLALSFALWAAGCGSSTTKVVTVTSTVTSSTTSSGGSPLTTLSNSSTTTTSASSTASSTTSTGAAAAVVHVATFKSPTGNIGCMIIAGTARCDLRQRSWRPPPRPHGCPTIVDFGQGLIVTGSGVGHLVCAGDTVLDPAARTLAYDTDSVVGTFRCQSRSTGVVCTNTGDGHGFFISLEAYRTF